MRFFERIRFELEETLIGVRDAVLVFTSGVRRGILLVQRITDFFLSDPMVRMGLVFLILYLLVVIV